jgi:protein-tyrosine phosphatase
MMETSVLDDGKKTTISVLFVCMGNICRSPLAEGIFRDGLAQAQLTGLVEVDSAGTGELAPG